MKNNSSLFSDLFHELRVIALREGVQDDYGIIDLIKEYDYHRIKKNKESRLPKVLRRTFRKMYNLSKTFGVYGDDHTTDLPIGSSVTNCFGTNMIVRPFRRDDFIIYICINAETHFCFDPSDYE
jgi:hypothetical protein